MPHSARFNLDAVGDLFQQLRYAPPETRERLMNAAERLLAEIEPERFYPEAFITFRVTGYRPETEADALLLGKALIQDLGNFVTRLSATLRLPAERNGSPARSIEDIARDLNVSTKSIERYRRRGLVCHYVMFSSGDRTLACYSDALKRFRSSSRSLVDGARRFAKIDAAEREEILNRARRLSGDKRLSRNLAARQIAREFDRSHEAIRQVLERHDRESDTPLFPATTIEPHHLRRIAYRASRLGVEHAGIANRYGRSERTIHRLVNQGRAGVLRRFALTWHDLPTFDRPDAVEVILFHRAMQTHLDPGPYPNDGILLLDDVRSRSTLSDADEHATIAGCNFLKRRLTRHLEEAGSEPARALLDEIETDFRWLGAVRHKLVMAALRHAVLAIERALGRRLEHASADVMVHALELSISECASAIGRIDPARDQKLDRVTSYGVARALAREKVAVDHRRASARHTPGSVMLRRGLNQLTPWRAAIGPHVYHRVHLNELERADRELMELHFGLNGGRPHTVSETAHTLGRSRRSTRQAIGRLSQALRRVSLE